MVTHLDPRPTDTILDLGCGDGVLTAQLAPRCRFILGLDASASMIATARATVTPLHANAAFAVRDCRSLPAAVVLALAPSPTATAAEGDDDDATAGAAGFTKVFSNAAMHWILRAPGTRASFFADVHALLAPGGSFVFELGGAGNVAEVHAALTAVLRHGRGLPLAAIRDADPWFFPDETWMRGALEAAGFEVGVLESEYRPTRLMDGEKEGGGLAGWVRLMGREFLALVEEGEPEGVVREVCDVLEGICGREKDGTWIGYVRLRGVAVKRA